MQPRLVLAIMLLVLACNRGEGTPLRTADGSLLSSSGGEVELADGSRLQFVVTSERYKQWDAARSSLRPNVVARFGTLLQPKSPTEKTIARAVAFLEADVASKEAIERTGMSVKDFVLMTVALEQEMRAVGDRGPRSEPVRSAAPLPVPVDSGYAAPAPAPLPPTPRVDTLVKPDTIFTSPRRDTSAPRRDTSAPKRDTVTAPKPPRDTVRDTTTAIPALPPDSESRT
jgi:hypothetical protein